MSCRRLRLRCATLVRHPYCYSARSEKFKAFNVVLKLTFIVDGYLGIKFKDTGSIKLSLQQ